jgi:hypothetical protein
MRVSPALCRKVVADVLGTGRQQIKQGVLLELRGIL